MNVLGRTRLFEYVDDALGVFHTHAVAGLLGGFLTGLFATAEGSTAFALTTPGGAIERNGHQVWIQASFRLPRRDERALTATQIVGGLFVFGWNLAVTPLILFFIKYVLRIPLRASEQVLLVGDDAMHGEAAYSFLDNDQPFHHHREHAHYDHSMDPAAGTPPGQEAKDGYESNGKGPERIVPVGDDSHQLRA